VSALEKKKDAIAESADINLNLIFGDSKVQMETKERVKKDSCPSTDMVEQKMVEERSKLGQCPPVLPSTLFVERYTDEERFDLEQGPHVSTPVVETKSETDEDRDQLKDYDIQIDRVRSATIKVPIHVNGRLTKAVLDTGVEVTVLNSHLYFGIPDEIRVITKLPNSEQSYKRKVKTHNYIDRQNQSTTGKL
jgi:hypothetical protein